MVWIHGVSVGEVKASQSLVAALRPHHDVVVSASTDSGLLVARELYPDLTVVRFPLDFRPVVARFLHCLQPTAIVLLELERRGEGGMLRGERRPWYEIKREKKS